MTKVYFVRHAEPDYNNHNDALRELTSKGMKDRKLVTNFLTDKHIDAVLSSPYKRAIDTVKDFADSQGMEINIINDFRERKVESEWIEDFTSFAKKQWDDFTYKLSDGECLQEVQGRNISALRQVLNKYAGKNVAVGSHGTALSTIINYYDHSFGYHDFERIKNVMPWIVEFVFDENADCIMIKKHDVISGVTT
jgi:2,3-bisphosphoglycerate-dependent phosphoglycerate mutase